MNRQTVISAKHLKKAFGKGESIQVIYSDLNIDMVLVKKWVGKYSIIYTASKLCVAMSFTV